MKKSIIVSGIFILSQLLSFSQSEWKQMNSPVTEDLTSLCFVNSSGWIVTGSGNIISTNDNGDTWNVKNFSGYHFESVHFVDSAFGVIVGWKDLVNDSSLILVTNDGGQSWEAKQHPGAQQLFDVFFINDSIGWSVGINDPVGWILYTADGGNTWTKQMNVIGVSGTLYSVHFRDKNIGKVCGEGGLFLHTNNGGTVGNGWALEISNPSNSKDLYALFNFLNVMGVAVGAEGTVLYTLDNWNNFISQNSNTTDSLNAVHGPPASTHIWAVGNHGTIVYSQNYLLGWNKQISGVTENLNDIQMLNNNEGWAVGNNGTILHYTESATGIGRVEEVPVIDLYPNPVSDRLFLKIQSGEAEFTVCLINSLGQVVKRYNVINQPEMSFDLSSLQPGIYLVQIKLTTGVLTKKIQVK